MNEISFDNYESKLNKVFENIFEILNEKYAEKSFLWKKTFDPLDDPVDIFSAHSETTKEPMHTAALADFLEDDNIGLLKSFIDNYCNFIKWEQVIKKEVNSQCLLYHDKKHTEKCLPDIVITLETSQKKYSIIIEGKIYASENNYKSDKKVKIIKKNESDKKNKRQLEWYKEAFDLQENKEKFGEAHFFFLTLDGKETKKAIPIRWMDLLTLAQRCIANVEKVSPRLYFLQLWIGSFLGNIDPMVSKKDFLGDEKFYYVEEFLKVLSFLDNASKVTQK